MTELNAQQTAFQERLQRLSQKQMQPTEPFQDTLAADYALYEARAEAARPKLSPEEAAKVLRPGIWQNLKYPMSFVKAFAVGFFAVLIMRVVRYHLTSDTISADGLDLVIILDGALAVGLGFVLRTVLALQAKELQTTQYIGILVGVTCMHNLYHFAPEPMRILTSPEWVREMQDYTVPYSIWYRGDYYVVYEDPTATEQTLPRAWSLYNNS